MAILFSGLDRKESVFAFLSVIVIRVSQDGQNVSVPVVSITIFLLTNYVLYHNHRFFRSTVVPKVKRPDLITMIP